MSEEGGEEMKHILLHRSTGGESDMLLGMVTDNVPDDLVAEAVEGALVDLAARLAAERDGE